MSEYTKGDRDLARALITDDAIALLTKVLNEKYSAEEQSEKNVIALSNERYGELMKVNFMVHTHVLSAITKLRALAKPTASTEKSPATAPK